MDVEGLRANGPGTRPRSSACRKGQDDFITNRYRVDIQYRGTAGFPPNAITFRALYGDGDDLDVRYEPDTATRMASVYLLNPATSTTGRPRGAVRFARHRPRRRHVNGTMFYNIGMPCTEWQLHAEPALRLPRRTGRSQRRRIREHRRCDLPQRVAEHTPRPETLGSALR